MIDSKLTDMLSKEGEEPVMLVKPIHDVANNKIYWQTEPFVRDGKIIVKRLAEADVEVEKSYNTIEEYDMTTNYGGKDDN